MCNKKVNKIYFVKFCETVRLKVVINYIYIAFFTVNIGKTLIYIPLTCVLINIFCYNYDTEKSIAVCTFQYLLKQCSYICHRIENYAFFKKA